MAKGLWFFLALCSLLACPKSHAAEGDRTIRQFRHTAWTAKDGAPPEIWALDQGPDGFLWLGTGSGLYRFDGISFVRFQPVPGERLESIDITAVKVLASGEIWIGYSDGGVSRLRDGHITAFMAKDGIAPGMVVGFRLDRDRVLWAVSHGGLSRFEQGVWHNLGADWNVPTENVAELFIARDGTLWLSAVNTLLYCAPGAHRFEPTGAVAKRAALMQSTDGRLWIADELHGLRPLPNYPSGENRSAWTLKDATLADSLSVENYAIDQRGAIWATDELNGGIFRFDPLSDNQPTHSLLSSDVDVFRRADGLTSDRSVPILADREGNIWVGTNAGLNRFSRAIAVADVAVPAMTKFGYSIAATPEATYISDGFWLYRAEPNQAAQRFVRLRKPAGTVLFRANDGALWYGNHDFMHRLQNNQISRVAMPKEVSGESILTMTDDTAGTLWVSFWASGLYQLKNGVWSGKVDLGGLPSPAAAASEASGAIWFGFTNNSVARRDAIGMRVFSARDGLEIGRVETITIRDSALLVGGEFGVALFDKGRFSTIGPDRVAPLFGVSGIGQTADGDFLFNGLLGVVRMKSGEVRKMFADASYSPTYDLYDRSYGLPGVAQQGWHTPTIVKGADGRNWLISNTGVAFLSAEAPERNAVPPPVTILSAGAGGVAYSTAKPLTLPKGVSSLSIAYTAASLRMPEKVRFRYRLENLDADWVDAGARREAVFSNLEPGSYRFHVIAANEDGLWNADGASLSFEIPPTFLQSWVFKLLVALSLVAALWLAYSQRVRVVANRIRMRTAARVEERERIARELHDTLLQSVQALTLRFQLAVDDLPKDAQARPALEKAIDHADDVIAEGRDRVRDLRLLQDSDIQEIIANIAKRQGFDVSVEIAVTISGTPRALDPIILDEVTRIASEAIFNIWRHARAKRVEIDIGYGASFSLRFADNGVGIEPDVADIGEKEGHFGLKGMRERAHRLSGRLVTRRLPQGGTEVTLVVPGSVAYKRVARRLSLWP